MGGDGGGLMAGDGHKRLNRPNRRVCDGGRWA